MVVIEKQPKRDILYPKYVFHTVLRMKNLKNREEFFTKQYHSKCSPRNFEGLKKKIDLCCYYESSTSLIWSNLVHVPKPLCCGMNIQNFLHIYKTLSDEHLSKKLEGWDFSFRNDRSFCKFGSVSLVTLNLYDVLLILLTPPYINYRQLSVLSVFKNAS